MNPFAALDVDGTTTNGKPRVRTTTTTSSIDASNGGGRRRGGRRNAETKRATLLEAALLEAKRNAAHEAMEARENERENERETWGKVGKGSGIKRSEAKKMAAALNSVTLRSGGKVNATAAEDARTTTTTTTTTTMEKKSDVVDTENAEDPETSSLPPPPMVSDAYKHVFEDTGATAWCVDVTDGVDGTVTRMSVTKAVPRMRKVSFKGKSTVVLAEEETRAVVLLWEEETRIDRARRAKARRKAAAKEAKEAAVAVASTAQTAVDENPSEAVVVSRPPPPGFERRAPMHSQTPPGFSTSTYGAQPTVRYVPIVDPNLEARQRQLEAQVAMLQAQLAAHANVGAAPARRAPPGFEANLENRSTSSSPGGKYVPPGRRR